VIFWWRIAWFWVLTLSEFQLEVQKIKADKSHDKKEHELERARHYMTRSWGKQSGALSLASLEVLINKVVQESCRVWRTADFSSWVLLSWLGTLSGCLDSFTAAQVCERKSSAGQADENSTNRREQFDTMIKEDGEEGWWKIMDWFDDQ
jgi:hypothetical protein